MSELAKIDLDETNRQNLTQFEEQFGDGKSIGDDMFSHTRSYSKIEGKNLEKQLEGLTQFLMNRNERDNMTPSQLISISNM